MSHQPATTSIPFHAHFKHAVGILTVIASLAQCLAARAEDRADEMSARLKEICRKHELPAMAAAVVNAKEIVELGCYGVRKRGTSDSVELSDKFPIGSNTKSMTGVLAAALVEAGKIKWETTIGEVWPKASDKDIHPKLRKVTLDQLLSHQSGVAENISELSPETWANYFDETTTPILERKAMLKLVLSRAPTHSPGTFHYSNVGYAIASAMLESRAGEAYEALMKKQVFDPLQMSSADFRSLSSVKQWTPALLWGHQAANGNPIDPRSKGAENPTVYAAAGTVHLSIEDYAKYARWQLAGKPQSVLRTQEAFDHLRKPQVDFTSPGAKYGCGWICVDSAMGPALNHAGSNTNCFALIWVIPESNFAAVACTNTGQAQGFTACNELITDLIAKYASKDNPIASPGSQPASKNVDPKALVGRYQLAANFVFDVQLKDAHLMVGITNQPTQEVFAESPTMWSYRSVKAKLEFHIGKDGKADSLTLHQNGLKQTAKRLGN